MTRKPDLRRNERSTEFRARRKAKLQTQEAALRQIRDDRVTIRTLDDAIAAAAVALARRTTKEPT